MIALLISSVGFVFLAALVIFFVWKSKAGGGGGSTGSGIGDSLKEEIPSVLAAIKGEKAADVITSSYFSSVYPGVQVVTSRASFPQNAPAFLLLTDQTGTITGVEANSVLWDSDANAAPVSNTTPKPTTKPTRR